MKSVSNFIIFISLFYLTFYVPFALTSYNSYWIKYGCNFHKRCEVFGSENVKNAADNLISFLLHKKELNDQWRENEKIHLNEVRTILDIMFVAVVLAVTLLIIFRSRMSGLDKIAAVNLIIALCLFIVLPNFKTFWRDIFHPILFDNDLWKLTRQDTLYYIMPRVYFKITTAVILSFWAVLNIFIVLISVFYKSKRKVDIAK